MAKQQAKAARKRPKLQAAAPRVLKRPAKLPNVWRLTGAAAGTLWRQRRIFLAITLLYGLLNLVLVRGLAAGNTDIKDLKDQLDQLGGGELGGLGTSLGVFVVLVGSAGNGSSDTAGAYQLFLALIFSLALIWTLRQLQAGRTVRLRDAFYGGMYPLIPFVLVLLVIGLQLLPLLIGSFLYGTVIGNGIAIHFLEKAVWLLIFLGLAGWTLYLLGASLFALYIVTLPAMTPLQALRSAKQLVKGRRLTVLRKLLWLPLALLVVSALVMVPIIIWLTPAAQWAFFVLTMLALAATHAYLYTLYRELLNE